MEQRLVRITLMAQSFQLSDHKTNSFRSVFINQNIIFTKYLLQRIFKIKLQDILYSECIIFTILLLIILSIIKEILIIKYNIIH